MRCLIFFLAIVCMIMSQCLAQQGSTPKLNCTNTTNFENGCGECNSSSPYAFQCGGSNHGLCIENHCECTDEYYGAFCADKRKEKFIAFMLAFMPGLFLGFPAGPCAASFYLGYTKIAIAQVVIVSVIWCLFFTNIILGGGGSGTSATSSASTQTVTDEEACAVCLCAGPLCCALAISVFVWVIKVLMILTITVWWFYTWISILTGHMKDSDDHKLAPF